MVNKFEAIGIGVSVGAMALALFLLRVENTDQMVAVDATSQAGTVVLSEGVNTQQEVGEAIVEASGAGTSVQKLIIDDVVIGTGDEVKTGDVVSVHYIGTLQNGQQFDNSYLKGNPFSYTVGAGKVIKGWEEGVLGMKVGGQRILVIPASMAYGEKGFGPIPANATLVFAIELLAIE